MYQKVRHVMWAIAGAVALLIAGIGTPALAQVATGTVTGTVHDAQGGAMPGATVTLTSATRGTSLDVVTNTSGEFTFPNVAADTYHARVSMTGFKALERRDIAVSPGDRVVIGTLTIEVGELSETITVSSEAPLIQAQTGERSFTIGTEAIQGLPMSNRGWNAMLGLTPGVVGSVRLGSPGANNNNVMMDGVAIMDTGNNGQMLSTNVEAIAEVKILTQGYQAEYGRASGMQITAVTKSGTNRFNGSVYDVERNSDWNANSWQNIENGIAKSISKQRDWATRSADPSAGPAARTSCSSSMATSTGHAPAAGTCRGSACRPRSSGRATSRRARTTTARSST